MNLNLDHLIALDALAGTKLSELGKHNPALLRELQGDIVAAKRRGVSIAFEDASKGLRDAVGHLDFAHDDNATRPVAQVLAGLLDDPHVTRELKREIAARLADAPAIAGVAVAGDARLREQPLLRRHLQRARFAVLMLDAGLPRPKVEAVLARLRSPSALNDHELESMVRGDLLSEQQARRLGFAASIDALADGNRGLAKELAGKDEPDLAQLVRLSAEEWEHALSRGGVKPPQGWSSRTYARELRRRVAELYPTEALLLRLAPGDGQAHARLMNKVQPLFERNHEVIGRDFDALDTHGLSAHDKAALREAHRELRRLVRQQPGLALARVIDGKGQLESKLQEVKRRLDLFTAFERNNSRIELLDLDLTAGSADLDALNYDGLGATDRKLVIDNLRAYQRTHALADDVDRAQMLLAAGYSSSVAVAAGSLTLFIANTGLPQATAEPIYHKAVETAGTTVAQLGAVIDIVKGGFNHTAVGNIPPSALDYLRKLDGFAELFGAQDYCDCEHCQSILSPAAYFVDLMLFIDEHVNQVHFSGSRAADVLALKNRRPDLWTLPLTCENTNTLLPTLDVINEILENAIAQRSGYAGDLGDRVAVARVVYRDALPAVTDSFRQPFLLPFARVATDLAHFAKAPADAAMALGLTGATRSRAVLGLSQPQQQRVLTVDASLAFLKKVYGAEFVLGGGGMIEPIETRLLIEHTGLTRQDIQALASSRYVTARGAQAFRFVQGRRSAESVQNDIERVHDLTPAILDRLHRFVRLARHLPWSLAETDLLLDQIMAAGLAPALDGAALDALAELKRLIERLQLKVEHAVALFTTIPTLVLDPAKVSLFDRLFNAKPFMLADGLLPKPAVKFIHPAFRDAAPPAGADATLPRLMAGFKLDAEPLAALIRELAVPLGTNLAPGSAEADRGFLLSTANLALLYRHARLMQSLKITAPQLGQLIALAGIGASVQTLAQASTLAEVFDAWKASSLSLDDLGFITRGRVEDTSRYPVAATLAATITGEVDTDRLTQFADTVFAFRPGVTEAQSRAIVAANAAAFTAVPNSRFLRLADTFNPAQALVMPAGASLAEADARATLMAFHASRILPLKLASHLALPADKLPELLAMTGADLSAAAVVQTINGGARAALETVIANLAPLALLFKPAAFDATALAFVRANAGVFAIVDFNTIGFASVRKLVIYRDHASASALDALAAQAVAPDAAAVRTVLAGFNAVTRFAGVDTALLAAALRVERPLVVTLLPQAALPATAPEALAMLGQAAALARELGLDGQLLRQLVADGYDDLHRAAEGLVGTLRTKYPDEADFDDKVGPWEDRIRSLKRDALVDYLIRSVHPEFDSRDELYQHFLVDVQLEGCARTSRVVAGLSSLQLYVHRILMNLEQDRRAPDDPQHTHVPPSAVPADEWEWRKNYRVWEANRKVFLYPENYIEPDLRDDKSPLFRELEQALLQQDINEQSVLDAYTRYLSGFEEIARLSIAGVYHDINTSERTDLLHMFAATQSDPPVYYYRAVENLYHGERHTDRGIVWPAWRKVDVQIPVRVVSPVVYLGRLFVFWVEMSTQSYTRITDGDSRFAGYKHKASVRYTTLRLDGSWSAPQALDLRGALAPYQGWGGTSAAGGVIHDPLVDGGEASYYLTVPRYDTTSHSGEPHEDYSLTQHGYVWDRAYPEIQPNGDLIVSALGFWTRARIDFVHNTLLPTAVFGYPQPGVRGVLSIAPAPSLQDPLDTYLPHLHLGLPDDFVIDPFAQATTTRFSSHQGYLRDRIFSSWTTDSMFGGIADVAIAELRWGDDLSIVNGRVSDAILSTGQDLIYLHAINHLVGKTKKKNHRRRDYIARRLGTRLADPMAQTLFTLGVDGLLATDTQKLLGEAPLPFTPIGTRIRSELVEGKMDFTGSLGVYFREIFFHVPALIANHLNAQGHYRAAQRWYRFIFDPTASETITVPAGLSAAEQAWRQRDRVWRYIEFRDRGVPKLREMLTDPVALETYKHDPFNPHAIARLRLSAYQKTIVMKTIANLLDWGDSLFTQFTTESINEATMLYVMAADILGPRPQKLGSCGEGAVAPKTYATIAPHIGSNEEMLIEMEQWLQSPAPGGAAEPVVKVRPKYMFDKALVSSLVAKTATQPAPAKVMAAVQTASQWGLLGGKSKAAVAAVQQEAMVNQRQYLSAKDSVLAATIAIDAKNVGALAASGTFLAQGQALKNKVARPMAWAHTATAGWAVEKLGDVHLADLASPGKPWLAAHWHFGWALVRELSPVFCVPENKDLLACWTRVEDRLFKVRNCMDITGVKRLPALFSPEIDPRLLVRARAAGLSLEDVLGAAAGSLPPYRFTYLIEKAKQVTASVQSYGSSLYAALERRDNEELSRLRLVHQQNLLKLTTKLRQLEIKVAKEAIAQLERQQAAVTYRRDYYQGLVDGDLNNWERAQQVGRHAASIASGAAALLQLLGAISYLVPQVGCPFAMKYGGVEIGNSTQAYATLWRNAATLGEQVAASAGLEAGFARRSEGWEHQVELAGQELKQIEKQLSAAGFRLEIAERSLLLHDESIQQAEEIFDFQNERFTNLGLYTYLATTMQRLFRQAYNTALAMARLAEQAYRFERNDDITPLLEASYWDATRGGLLTGEKLMVDLLALERRFIESNLRTMEVDQACSMSQIDPAALLALKETGTCSFAIPELAFDLFYPGQYRRRIKSVRLTVPCVTGPFTNVSATLTMTGSKIRREPVLGDAQLFDVPLRRSTTIATSTAQNDAGVFEFSFRDERYMPFEGAGAISAWRVSLPANFRPFDYQTITDVIVHVAYTAEFDDVLKTQVEQANAAIEGTIAHVLTNVPMSRTFSLRQDFSSVFTRLVHSAAGTEVRIEITPRHFPLFLQGRNLQIDSASLVLRTLPAQTVAGVRVAVNGAEQAGFVRDPLLGNLFAKPLGAALAGNPIGTHRLVVVAAGDLAPNVPVAGDLSVWDLAKVQDVMLQLNFKLA